MSNSIKNILPLLLLFLLACAPKSDPASSADDTTTLVDDQDFNEFFEKFKADSLFQIERVKFPFRVHDYDGELLIELKKSDWRHASFFYDEAYATRELDAYTQGIKAYGDTIKLEYRGIDNGIWIDYEFLKGSGKWILVSEKDESN
jgi:hypothetical protein